MDAAALLAAIPVPALVIGNDYRITMASPAIQEIFNSQLIGQNAVSLFRQPQVLSAMDAAIRDGKPGEARFVLAEVGAEVTYRFRANPLDNGAVLSLEDHSGFEASARMRRDFIADISHELRTPLTGLRGFIETLRTSARDDPEARARFLAIMDGEAQRMGRLVEDLMQLSRVEENARVRPREEVNLAGVLRSVIATMEGKLADAQMEIEAKGLEDRVAVQGDRDQLIQLFLNLLENAVKYASDGRRIEITLGAVERDVTLRCAAVRVDIKDFGDGIDSVHLPRLTERFYRIDGHRSREMGGTGLGLAIVKHIVNRHRSRMKITSEPGQGMQVSVILPR